MRNVYELLSVTSSGWTTLAWKYDYLCFLQCFSVDSYLQRSKHVNCCVAEHWETCCNVQSQNLTHHLTLQFLVGHTFTSYLFGHILHTHDPKRLLDSSMRLL